MIEQQYGGHRQRPDGRPVCGTGLEDDSAMQGALGIIIAVGCILGFGLSCNDDDARPVYVRCDERFPVMCFGRSEQIIERTATGDSRV